MGIGIAEKSHETRRDCWGGNVNHAQIPILSLHDSYASFVDGSSVMMLYLLNGSFMMLLE